MKDSHERTIDYMRISITDRCNLRCKYCTPEDLPSISHDEIMRFEDILTIARLAGRLGICKFKVTGGEPFVRKGCLSFLKALKELPDTKQVTLTTNGVYLKEHLKELKALGINGVNISLDTLHPDTFHQITGRPDFDQVMDAILTCQASGIRTKVNTVLLKGINDHEFWDLLKLAQDYPIDVRFIEIMPIGYGRQYQGYDKNALLPLLASKYPDYHFSTKTHGNGPAIYVSIPGFLGSIGFIDAIHGKFCHQCNRVRLTSDGMLKLCLYYNNGINLKKMLREQASEKQLLSAMQEAIFHKPSEHQFYHSALEGSEELRKMSQIGG